MKIKLYTLVSIIGAVMLMSGSSHASGIRQVTPDEAAKLIQANSGNRNFVILDIRTPGEYRNGHIPNSVLLDFYSPGFRNGLATLDRNRTYLIYCRSDNRTGRAIGIMQDLGFGNIYELRGGIKSWLSSGRVLQVQ